jgi:hypothetical protein
METQLRLTRTSAERQSFPFRPAFVRAVVAAGYPGVYLLLHKGRPIYVGRSDTCVQTRLASHPYLGRADRFMWQPCRSPVHAFHLESFWYHALLEQGGAGNLIHPARPAGTPASCPFCGGALEGFSALSNDVDRTFTVIESDTTTIEEAA